MTKFDWFIAGISVLILSVMLEVSLNDSSRYVKYDCRVAEISPDIPLEVKQLCRGKK